MIHYQIPSVESTRELQGFSAFDISLPATDMNIAEICLTNRYPERGTAINKQSEMIVRVLKGEVTFHCEGEEVLLPQDSTVLVQINKPYYWIPQGFVKILVVSSPPWTPEQHENVSECLPGTHR